MPVKFKKVVCLAGPPKSQLWAYAERLQRDLHYEPLKVSQLISNHIKNNTPLGALASKFTKSGKNVPAFLIADILQVAIDSAAGDAVLLVGFPRAYDQAVALEALGYSISRILELRPEEDTARERINSKFGADGEGLLQQFLREFAPVEEAYSKLGRLKTVNESRDELSNYEALKKALQPYLCFVGGPPCSGRKQVSEGLAKLTGWKLLQLQTFAEKGEKDLIGAINRLGKYLRLSSECHFVVSGFFSRQSEAQLFITQFQKPNCVFLLEHTRDELSARIVASYQSPQREEVLREFQAFSQQKPAVYKYLEQQGVLRVVQNKDVGQSLKWIKEQLLPKIIVTDASANDDQARSFFGSLERSGLPCLDVKQMALHEVERKSALGKEISPFAQTGKFPARLQVELLRKAIFANLKFPYVLVERLDCFKEFVTEFSQPDFFACIELKKKRGNAAVSKDSPVLSFVKERRVIAVESPDVAAFKAKLTRPLEYGFVLGPIFVGKTTVCKQLAKTLKLKHVEWEAAMTSIKEQLSTPENPIQDLPPAKVIDWYAKNLKSQGKVLFDSFPFQASLYRSWVSKVGPPAYVVLLKVDKAPLVKRFKAKSEMDQAAELGEEDQAKIDGFLKRGDTIFQEVRQVAAQTFQTKVSEVDANGRTDQVLATAVGLFRKRVVPVHVEGEFGEELTSFVARMCLSNKFLFVDVPHEISRLIERGSSKMLDSQLAMRWTLTSESNPSNFTPESVAELVEQCLQGAVSDSDTVVLLGYPNGDIPSRNKTESENHYPRFSDELLAIQKRIGKVEQLILVSRKFKSFEIKSKKVRLQSPVKPKAAPKEGEEAPPAEEEPKKQQYSIYDYEWSQGTSRALSAGQWFMRRASGTEELRFRLGGQGGNEGQRLGERLRKGGRALVLLQAE